MYLSKTFLALKGRLHTRTCMPCWEIDTEIGQGVIRDHSDRADGLFFEATGRFTCRLLSCFFGRLFRREEVTSFCQKKWSVVDS
jgi:hypothetical protein